MVRRTDKQVGIERKTSIWVQQTDVQIEALKTNDMLIPILSGSVKSFFTDRHIIFR